MKVDESIVCVHENSKGCFSILLVTIVIVRPVTPPYIKNEYSFGMFVFIIIKPPRKIIKNIPIPFSKILIKLSLKGLL